MVGSFDDLEDKLFMLKMNLVFGEIIHLIYCSSAPVGEDEDVMHSGHFSTIATHYIRYTDHHNRRVNQLQCSTVHILRSHYQDELWFCN